MSIFSIGMSGLNAAQRALTTTSNNVSNVHTPGYNRELALLTEQPRGSGVRVSDVQRQFDHFVATQLNSSNSAFHSLQSYNGQISQIDNLLGDLDAGLAPIMDNFFSALQDLAGSPSDPAARQGVLGTAQTLTAQFRSLDNYLSAMAEGIDGQLSTEVNQINNTVEQIANLNEEIGLARARSGKAPNALLNQRDQLVAELSERIDTEMTIQNGHYNITVGNGQPLVSGTQSYRLTTLMSASDPTRSAIGYLDAAGNEIELRDSTFSAGALGGLMKFREESLIPVQNQVGQMAVSLAMAFNAQHNLGTDLNGDPGADFFAIAQPSAFSHTRNNGTAGLSAVFSDHEQLRASDYHLKFDAGSNQFEVSRLQDGSKFQVPMDPVTGEISLDGMVLTIDDPAALVDGDRFELQPTRRAAASFDSMLGDIAQIAAGLGGGSGNNENALALQALQSTRIVGGNATLSQSYGTLVAEVGNRSNIVQVNLNAQEGLTDQLRAVQQSESGVNMDEEAANLIRYQQYYQANAKVIEVGTTLFDVILGLRS